MSDHREESSNHGNDSNHGNGRRNGLRDNTEQMEDVVVAEDDLVEVVDINDGQAPDVAEDLDMLDLAEMDPDQADVDPDGDVDPEDESAMMLTPERDDAQLVFSEHKGSVFCVGVGQSLVVTGGEDDKAFVWNTATGESIITCTGHKDSVTMVGFSHDVDLVATGDLSGFIQVWNLSTRHVVWSFEVSDLEWLSWHHSAPVLLAGTVDGDIWMWKIPGHDTKTFQSFGSACNVGKILPDGKRVVAGYGDGSIRVWDLKSATVTHTLTGQNAHTKAVTSVSCHSDNTLALTGSTDCSAMLINTTTGKVISRFECRRQQKTDDNGDEDGVESVGLCNTLPFAATGTLSGSLDIWDVPTQICRQRCVHEAGIVKLFWDDAQPLVYTSSLDGVVRLWDSRNGQCVQDWTGHEAPILDMQIIQNDRKLITTSDDHTARVFSL